MSMLNELFESLDKRYRPEKVAKLIKDTITLNNPEDRAILDRIASRGGYYSSMSEDFQKHPGMDKSLELSKNLFGLGIDIPSTYNINGIEDFICEAEKKILVKPSFTDFKYDRLPKAQRKVLGLDISRRQYNKLFRLAARLEKKHNKLACELEKREFQQVSKSRFASKLTYDDFSADIDSACFIAYYTAKCNLRNVFTNTKQDRPFDELCDVLFKKCLSHPETTCWWAIAHVYPDKQVLFYLTEAQRGKLLGQYFDVLTRLSKLLKVVWEKSKINRRSMVVKPGDDSTTWNVMAGAWNKARGAWLSLLYSLDSEAILDEICPGKVLRLMAADVAAWHRLTGGKLEPDTAVWNDVPLPWEVLDSTASCTRIDIEKVCAKYGVDAKQKGWLSPLESNVVHAYRPTPELVHGVEVFSPHFAKILRKLGAFSGKAKPHLAIG